MVVDELHIVPLQFDVQTKLGAAANSLNKSKASICCSVMRGALGWR
jgi:hypothetical protein